jgi:hypothetical protein
MSDTRYIVTVRGDAAHALEINLETATRVLLGIHAPYPRGRGIEVLSVERAPRGDQGPVPLYDGHGLPPCPCCNGRAAGQGTAALAELGVDFPPDEPIAAALSCPEQVSRCVT